MKICFFGLGGVGGYFGSVVAEAFNEKHDFYFVARGSHKEAICKNGLTLKKAGGDAVINVRPKICTDTAADLPMCDLIVLSVKSYDLAAAVKDLSKIAHEKTIVLPLLNGVDIYERIREHLPTGIVLPSCVYIGTHIESPGVIYQNGGSCRIFIGKDPKFPDFYPEALLTLLKGAKVDFSWEEDVRVSIWSKFMFVAAYGLVSAVYEKTLGEILENSDLSHEAIAIMGEVYQIAQKLNVPLDSNAVETSYLKANQFPFETKTSFQRDVESKGKVNEGDLFAGTLIRFGETLGLPTRNTRDIYERLIRKFDVTK